MTPAQRLGSRASQAAAPFRDLGVRLRACMVVGGLLPALGLGARAAEAQYFGQNKVQYKDLDFQVLSTEHFHVYFYPSERPAAALAARLAERWYARHARLLNHQLSGPQPLILYASHPDFAQTNVVTESPGEGTGGVTEILKRRISLALAGPLAESDHVIGHELVHAFQFDMTSGTAGCLGVPAAARMPLWFIEGMAEYLSLGPVDPNTAMWMRDAVHRNKVPTIKQLDRPEYFPYRYGQALWAYLAGRYGDQVVGDLLRAAGRTGNVERALAKVTKRPVDSLSSDWQRALRAAYAPLEQTTQPAAAYGRRLVLGGDSTSLTVAPTISPDGKRIAFFSSLGLFSIDLYLADLSTGKILKKLVTTALDPHFQSLEFINSSGAWDATGKRFAFGALVSGRPVLSVLDVDQDRTVREIALPDLGEIFSPTWSPDGRSIAFSALVGGLTDLFIYDLDQNRLRRLTDDAYADLQPAWSPDGRWIAFATDRYSTALGDLRAGNYRLALLDVASGEIRPLPASEVGKHIDPHWSPDGRLLYFLSDRTGITNLYRLDLVAGTVRQLTNLLGGATGITALSPGLAVASQSGRLVFSSYEEGGYHLYAVDDPAGLPESVLAAAPALGAASPAMLPPQTDRSSEPLLLGLENPQAGLPGDPAFPVAPYHPRLSLDHVAQPYLAAGVDAFGTFVGGGTSLYWSDVLGNQSLVTGLQVLGRLQDLSALVAYENRAERWGWGLAAQQVPYLASGFAASTGSVNGDLIYTEQDYLARQVNQGLTAVLSYPFNRVERLDFSAGARRISFGREVRTRATSLYTGQVLLDSTLTLPAPSAIGQALGSVALVYDNSYVGATSPILGQRYRLEASPMVGSLSFGTLLADYRRYILPVRPFTLAGRLLHYGRYGPDAEDQRLTPVFLGYPGLVRGYNAGSFSGGECAGGPAASCPAFDRLLGSRLLVTNVELRFPLLGALGVGHGYYGAFPIELGVFTDGGVAWATGHDPSFVGGDRKPVWSAGAALRVNLLGYAVAELDFVRPFQRPDKGWYFEFTLLPGF